MAKQFPKLEEPHKRFIADLHVFFGGTAAADGRVNVSPKGQDSLRILGDRRILWRNLTGSGNETAPHLDAVPRMTLMWCSFTAKPLILRCYGTARAVHRGEADWDALNARFPPHPGARQVFDMAVDLVQTSCGYAVPFMDAPRTRDTLDRWTDDKGQDGVRAYWVEKNAITLDGRPSHIVEKSGACDT